MLRPQRAHIIRLGRVAHRPFLLCVPRQLPASSSLLAAAVAAAAAVNNPHRQADVVLILLDALDHGDLVDNVVDADEEFRLFFDGIAEERDGLAEAAFELFVALCDFARLVRGVVR